VIDAPAPAAPSAQIPVEAYVDEAGAKGFLRNLNAASDGEIALIGAIAIPRNESERFRNALTGPFERFKNARPSTDYGLHITDAFGSGDANWATVAGQSRNEIIANIRKLQMPVVFDARRLRVARESYERMQTLLGRPSNQQRSNISISTRPSAERVEETCMIGLAIKLDCLAIDFGLGQVDLMTDQLDRPISELFKAMMERTRTVSAPDERVVAGWDRVAKKKGEGSIRMNVVDVAGNPVEWLDSKHLGDLVVLGKDDPLVFAADVVVNALYHHLKQLPLEAPLNSPSSVAGWSLADRVYGVREDAYEDNF
jgi:hypothetical protein